MPIAHAADWIATAVVMGPALLFFAWLGVGAVRERRRGGEPDGEAGRSG